MDTWQDVAPVSRIPPGSRERVVVDGQKVVVFNLAGRFYGLHDVCSHDGGELSNGLVTGESLICPRHGARFDIRTGAVLSPPAYEDVKIVATRVVNDMVQVARPA